VTVGPGPERVVRTGPGTPRNLKTVLRRPWPRPTWGRGSGDGKPCVQDRTHAFSFATSWPRPCLRKVKIAGTARVFGGGGFGNRCRGWRGAWLWLIGLRPLPFPRLHDVIFGVFYSSAFATFETYNCAITWNGRPPRPGVNLGAPGSGGPAGVSFGVKVPADSSFRSAARNRSPAWEPRFGGKGTPIDPRRLKRLRTRRTTPFFASATGVRATGLKLFSGQSSGATTPGWDYARTRPVELAKE